MAVKQVPFNVVKRVVVNLLQAGGTCPTDDKDKEGLRRINRDKEELRRGEKGIYSDRIINSLRYYISVSCFFNPAF